MSIFKDVLMEIVAFAGLTRGPMLEGKRTSMSVFTKASSLLLLVIMLSPCSWAAVNVSLGASVPVSLQAEFLKDATSQYVGTLTKSPYFADTYSFVITGKKPVSPPPPTTAIPCTLDDTVKKIVEVSTWNYVYGVGNGMDIERYADIQQIYQLQGQDYVNKTCGGQTVQPSTTAWFNACIQAYTVMTSTISQRWGYIFTPTGQIVP